jgi:hypothetical protein
MAILQGKNQRRSAVFCPFGIDIGPLIQKRLHDYAAQTTY